MLLWKKQTRGRGAQIMWELEQSDLHRRKGLEAIQEGAFRDGRFHCLKSAEYLLKAAKKSGPEFQQIRREQAKKLMDLAKQCEERMNRPATIKVGGGDQSGGRSGSDSGGGADKHLTDFQPLPPGKLKMDGVVGLEEVKRQVKLKVIYPLQHPEIVSRYRSSSGGGILLYGPPGTGKTMIAKAIAGEVEAPFFNVKPSDILAPLVGVAERNIAKLFETLRERRRAVLFLDELDALLPERGAGSDSNIMARIVPQFLQEMQGASASLEKEAKGADDAKNGDAGPTFLLILGATNAPWAIDPAVLRPGRFDELIYVDLPDLPARRKLFEINLKDKPVVPGVDLDALAEASAGFSGADIADMCSNASELALEAAIAKGEVVPIGHEDVLRVVQTARPSVRPEHLKKFAEFAEAK
jgi:SpoVK/Ycf46/Vps4 family AAA+-type ATPase